MTDRRDEALDLAGRGEPAVLIVPAEAPAVPMGRGRIALMVGDPGDPDTVVAAEEMHRELYG